MVQLAAEVRGGSRRSDEPQPAAPLEMLPEPRHFLCGSPAGLGDGWLPGAAGALREPF